MRIIRAQTAEEFNSRTARDLAGLQQRLGTIGWLKTYPPSERPDATQRTGQGILDATSGRPLWSNGTDWVDPAAGALTLDDLETGDNSEIVWNADANGLPTASLARSSVTVKDTLTSTTNLWAKAAQVVLPAGPLAASSELSLVGASNTGASTLDVARVYLQARWVGTSGVDPVVDLFYTASTRLNGTKLIAVVESNATPAKVSLFIAADGVIDYYNVQLVNWTAERPSLIGGLGWTYPAGINGLGQAALPAGTQTVARAPTFV